MLNTATIQKSKIEEASEILKFKFNSENDLVLYWHFQTIKSELMPDLPKKSRKIAIFEH